MNVLILDNSPRRLGRAWFGRWLRRLGAQPHAFHLWSRSRVPSLDPFAAVLISGSPASATDDLPWIRDEMALVESAANRGLPILGVCFGAQLLARVFYGSGAVTRAERPEVGWHTVERSADDALFQGAPERFTTFQFHFEEVAAQPGMQVLATSQDSTVQAYRIEDRPIWGLQFHLEVTPRAGRDFLRKTRRVYESRGVRYDDLARVAVPCEAAPVVFSNFIQHGAAALRAGGIVRA